MQGDLEGAKRALGTALRLARAAGDEATEAAAHLGDAAGRVDERREAHRSDRTATGGRSGSGAIEGAAQARDEGEIRPHIRAEELLEGILDVEFRPGEATAIDVRAVSEQRQHPFGAKPREALQVEIPAVERQ